MSSSPRPPVILFATQHQPNQGILHWFLIRPQRPLPNLKKVPGVYLRFIAETVRVRAFAGADGGVPARSSFPLRS